MEQYLSDRLPEALVRAVAHRRTAPQNGRHQEYRPAAPTIAISREVGAGGTSLAQLLGRRLDWPVYDQELMVELAREMHVRVCEVENVDERHVSWLEECVEAMSPQRRVNECSYVKHLSDLLWTLGSHGACVIVGRGAAHLLPSGTTLRVRLIADFDDRADAICAERGLTPTLARAYIESTERARVRFVKDHFRKDPSDMHNYDLVLNSSRTPLESCSDLIVQALQHMENRTPLFAKTA